MTATVMPIVIAPYDPAWREEFRIERAMLFRACGPDAFVRVEHIGSTAVPGLAAKPVVDIMPGVRSLDAFMRHVPAIVALGYEYVREFEQETAAGPGMPFRRYFRKSVDGVRRFHVHVVEHKSDFWVRQLRFRNWLRCNPEDREAYAALKRKLATAYNATGLAQGLSIDEGYTDHKSALIEDVLRRAGERIAASSVIELAPYDPAWPDAFERERALIERECGDAVVAIEHVGSTSVPELIAKPKIDVAVGLRAMSDEPALRPALARAGFVLRGEPMAFDDWRIYVKRAAGGVAAQAHVVPYGGLRWSSYLLFRDRLRAHQDEAQAYARLKRELAAEFGRDRMGYPEAKADFVDEILRRAGAPVF